MGFDYIKHKTFAIDFDGTIIDEGYYPDVGVPKPNAINVMNRIIENGGRIIIWTCRGGKHQEEAIRIMLNTYRLYDFIINDNYQDVKDAYTHPSPKVLADYYIDDRNIFFKEIDWYEIENILFPPQKQNIMT